jgi:hypothetical protein
MIQKGENKKSEKDKIGKHLATITKRKKKTQINKIRHEKGDMTTNINRIQRIIKEYF